MKAKERPALFNRLMVKAILEGIKTQTRRVIKLDWMHGPDLQGYLMGEDVTRFAPDSGHILEASPFEVGMTLWVKERHQLYGHWKKNGRTKTGKQAWKFITRHSHKVLFDNFEPNPKRRELLGYWSRPSIFMPRWASRITLEITSVRVEQVQEIRKADCIAEGITDLEDVHAGWHQSYAQLWDSINGKKHPWKSNPWVWAVTFKKI